MRGIRNERGLTLLELLAAMTIGAVVLGTAMLLMGSLNHLYMTSTQNYQDNTDIKRTLRTISARLADSNAAAAANGGTELRFRSGDSMQAVVFDAASRTLTVFTFNGTKSQFDSPSLSRTSNPELYANPYVLAEHVRGMRVSAGGSAWTAGPAATGQLLQVEIRFERKRIDARGRQEAYEAPKTITVKLLEDFTDK